MEYVDKDSLGTSKWLFWIGIVATFFSFSIVCGLNYLAITAERGAPLRQVAFQQKVDGGTPSIKEPGKEKRSHPVIVEAAQRSLSSGWKGWGTVLLIVSLNYWWQKRPYKIQDDTEEEYVDPVARGRTVK